MKNLQEIQEDLTQRLSGLKSVKSVSVYRDKVVVVEFSEEDLKIGLDVEGNGDVFLVFRTPESQTVLEKFFNINLNKRVRIFSNNVAVPGLGLPETVDSLADGIRCVVDRLSAVNSDSGRRVLESSVNVKTIVKYELFRTYNEICRDMADFYRGRFLNILGTIEDVGKNRRSLARFGDGEIKSMVTSTGCGFQKHDWRLMQELRDIAGTRRDLLVCFPNLMSEDVFWRKFWMEYWPACSFYIHQDVIGDTMVTRPEAFRFYRDRMVQKWVEIWEGKRVCFVTGKGSRLNAGHLLFSNVKEQSYVYSKNQDAYDEIDVTFEKCLSAKETDIYLLALGPTGTALASRLEREGKWALDIGHLNNSYDMVYHKARKPEKLFYQRGA